MQKAETDPVPLIHKTSLAAAKIQIECIGSIEMEKGLMHCWFA
jgi:hypothetical protein